MKNTFITILTIVAVLWLIGGSLLDDSNARDERVYRESMEKVQVPDPNREVYGWDYSNNTYLYKDQVPARERYVEGVTTKNSKTTDDKPDYIWVDGKRYFVYYRSHGIEYELEEE